MHPGMHPNVVKYDAFKYVKFAVTLFCNGARHLMRARVLPVKPERPRPARLALPPPPGPIDLFWAELC